MTQPQVAPYGTWKSPITTAAAFAKTISISEIRLDGDVVYWSERRPDGNSVVVCRGADGQSMDVTPPAFNVRTRVHEYGGGDFLVADGTIYFSNFSDQRLYCQHRGGTPEPLTTLAGMRYADACMDRQRRRLIVIREDHTAGNGQPITDPTNTIISVDLTDGDHQQVLVGGNDFYASPRLSPDGKRLAWLTWNHPNMPWDAVELWVGDVLPDGAIGQKTLVAGATPESILQPAWSQDGALYFVADRTGWWNLYRWRADEGQEVEALCPMAAEFGEAQWVFALSHYAFVSADRLVCTYTQNGSDYLAILDLLTSQLSPINLPYTSISDLQAAGNTLYFMGGSAHAPNALVRLDFVTGATEELVRSFEVTIDSAYFSIAQPVEFPTEGGLTAHGFFYPPQNRDFVGPADERPPLVVNSHGGPTSRASSVLKYRIQYWTSRGFAVLDVDYGGSTGYGRAYRERLKGQWGVVDVADCVNGAKYFVAQGLVDSKRLTIAGGSAGGFTTLSALTFHDTFRAGASYYGVSDLEALTLDTHKFESRYLDALIGPYPERRDLYVERSPIYHTRQLACPIILLQGLDDPVVPPNQSELMFEAVREREIPVAYVAFPGEQHGFRKAENNQRALEAEYYFYAKVFGFDVADEIEPIEIENL